MFGSEILEVVIGLLFIYLLLSLLATTINEIVLANLAIRGKILQKAIRSMLSDSFDPEENLDEQLTPDEENTREIITPSSLDLGVAFYEHPYTYKLAKKGKQGRPSYISRENFSHVVIALLSDDTTVSRSFAEVEAHIKKLPPGGTRKLLITLLADSQGELLTFRLKLENWFDNMMDRASGWYKRQVQHILLIIGLFLSIAFNADTFQIAKKLSDDPEARQKVIKMAEDFTDKYYLDSASTLKMKDPNKTVVIDGTPETLDSQGKLSLKAFNAFAASQCDLLKQQRDSLTKPSKEEEYYCRINKLNNQVDFLVNDQIKQASNTLGLGWGQSPFKGKDVLAIILKILGWLMTALAISLGAPFWFDLLNKLMNIRSSGRKPEEKAP